MFLRTIIRAALPTALVLFGLAGPAAAQEDAATKEARVHHEKGIAELKAARPDYAEAYREFKTAYAASPKWQILGSLGIAALHLERDGEAIAAFEKFLVEGGSNVPADIRSQTENDLATLRATLVRVSITVNQSGATLVDERLDGVTPVINRYESLATTALIGVRAGKHRMSVTLPGYEPAVWEFDGAPKAELSHAFELRAPGSTPPAPSSEPRDQGPQAVMPPDDNASAGARTSPAFLVAAIGTGALLAAGTTTGILAVSAKNRFNNRNDGQRVDDARSLRDNGEQLAFVTDVLLGATVLAAAGTTYLYFSGRPTSRKAERAGTTAVIPAIGTRSAWIGLRGSF